jgi:hypothetical protein
MDAPLFEKLESTLRTQGADAAIDKLLQELRESKQYDSYFYALLLKKRHELGVLPVPTGPSQDLPESVHAPYEEAIRAAAREVGNLYLADQDVSRAWLFFRMIDDPAPVRAALDTMDPEPDSDIQPLVHLAFYEGVHPRKGFDWILSRYGLCSAITTLGGHDLPFPDDVKQYCVKALVRTLVAELRGRVQYDIEQREGKLPEMASSPPETPGVLRQLLVGRESMFGEESYHIDLSHLSSVVQMATMLPPSPELELARDAVAYGTLLSPKLVQAGEPPFDDMYAGYAAYLAVTAGDNVEQNLEYFRKAVANADAEEGGTFPAETLVNLLLRANRPTEALAVARKHLAHLNGQRLTCPSLSELCHKVKDYRTLAEVAREQGDPVHFVAGLLAAK